MNEYQQSDESSEGESQVELTAQQIDVNPSIKIDDMRGFQLELIDVAQNKAELAFEFARELASAKTPSELIALCMTHAQKQMAAVAEQSEEMIDPDPKMTLPNAYIEARPKGRQEHDPIEDFVVEDDAGQVLGTFDTQMEAILSAKDAGHAAQVVRRGDLNDKTNPDHWRSY